MFWLGFIAAFGVATVVVILWMEWDKRKQVAEERAALDEHNTRLLLYRVSDLEDKVAAIVAKELLEVELKKGAKRG